MSNIANNTTIDGKKIISESDSNNHRHDTSQIIGLSDSAIGDSFIYSEFIDGVSYVELQSQFISDSNNTMTGTLNISTNSNNENNIINVFELNTLKSSNNIASYEITNPPPVEEVNTSQRSIMVTGSNPSVDLSWTPSLSSGTNASISVVGADIVSSNQTIELEITNYSTFDNYTVSTNKGTVSLNNVTGVIEYQSPSTAPSTDTATISIENVTRSVIKEISITIAQDPQIAVSFLNDGTYESIVNSITINSSDDIILRIENYDSNYTYNVTTSSTSIASSISNDIITLTLPENNPSQNTETVTISRTGDSFTFDLIMEPYTSVYSDWIVSTLGGSGNDYFLNTEVDPNGDIIAVGYQSSDTQGSSDILLAKYDSNLNLIAQATMGDSEVDVIDAICMVGNNYIVAGQKTASGGTSDCLIMKLDSNFNILTQKMLGGGNSDTFEHLIPTNDGGVIAVGGQYSDVPLTNATISIPLVVKYDSNLNIISKVSLNYDEFTYYSSVAPSHEGGIICVGSNTIPTTIYDSNLNIVAQRREIGPNALYTRVIQSNNGGYIVCGYRRNSSGTKYDALLIEYDSNLNELNTIILTGANDNYFMDIISTGDGYMAVGYQLSDSLGVGTSDMLFASYDNNLNLLSHKSIGSTSTDNLRGICKLNDNEYFAVGNSFNDGDGMDATIIKVPKDLSAIANTTINNHPNLSWVDPYLTHSVIASSHITTALSTINPNLYESLPEMIKRSLNLTETKSTSQ